MAVRKTEKGASLKRWFKEDWKDVRTGKACGRKKGEKRGTPYCRPTKKVSSKTPKTSGEMTAAEKKKKIAEKKKLGQPAGKPRRVKSLKRKKSKRVFLSLTKRNLKGTILKDLTSLKELLIIPPKKVLLPLGLMVK